MALTKIRTGGITADAVDNTILKLDDDFALTGTVTGAGVSTATSTLPSEGGAATTIVAQGLIKAWFNLNAIGTEAYRDTFNIGSVTDNATGDFSHNFTNDMASANHATANSTSGNDSTTGVNSYNMYFEPQSTGAGFTRSQNISSGGTALDVGYVIGMVAGDLA